MSQKAATPKKPAERVVRDIRRATRRIYSAEEKVRIVLDGLRGEDSIAESMYYSWSKEFLEAGKKRLAGDTARAATTDEVKALCQEYAPRKQLSPNRRSSSGYSKNSMIAAGDDSE